MEKFVPQLVDLVQTIIYCLSFVFALKCLRTKKTKKLSIKFKHVAITTEYFDN